jgi:nucleoside-diphosphate-sugar epimerase
MRVFVTGGSGFIGSAVVPELINAGHTVIGLARSDASATRLTAAGAQVRHGTLEDLDVLRAGAAESDGVIHLGFIHDFSAFDKSVLVDRNAIAAFGDALAGSDRPLVIASGLLGVRGDGKLATEQDRPDVDSPIASGRQQNAAETLALAERGVRTAVLRLPPTVHGAGDKGFVAHLVEIARQRRVAGYPGAGDNRWPAVHRLDAAELFRLALEKAPAGTVLHGAAEQGVSARTIAETIGRRLDLPVTSIAPQDAAEHFGWIGPFFGMDAPSSNTATRELLGWQPTQPGLVEDMERNYFTAPNA